MYRVACALLLACFIASATGRHVPVENSDAIDALIEKDTKELGQEALLLGQVLRDCAKDLKDELTQDFVGDEAEEYSIRDFWNKTKSGFKNAGNKVKEQFKKVGTSLKDKDSFLGKMWIKIKTSVKNAAKKAQTKIQNAAEKFITEKTEKLEEFLSKKAEQVIDGLVNKQLGSSLKKEDKSYDEFVKDLSKDIDKKGADLIKKGIVIIE